MKVLRVVPEIIAVGRVGERNLLNVSIAVRAKLVTSLLENEGFDEALLVEAHLVIDMAISCFVEEAITIIQLRVQTAICSPQLVTLGHELGPKVDHGFPSAADSKPASGHDILWILNVLRVIWDLTPLVVHECVER